jgi:hypothetical protein
VIRLRRPGLPVLTYELGPKARWPVVAMRGDRIVVEGVAYQVTARDWITPIPFVRGLELIVDVEPERENAVAC